jgi:hypothetical protein
MLEQASIFLRRALPARAVGPALSLFSSGNSRSLMARFGYGKSLKSRQPLAEDGSPLPWMPYVVTEILKSRLGTDLDVFEFGGGFSTQFFMTRVKTVTTVEHNAEWSRDLQSRAQPNVSVMFRDAADPAEYAAAVLHGDRRYDLVVVDGIARPECFANAVRATTARGVILLDDSDRASYAPCFAMGKEHGFNALSLVGHKPGSISVHQSTLFYKPGNCLGL